MKKLIETEWVILAGTAALALVSGITTKNPTYVLWGVIAISGSARCITALERAERAKHGEDFYKKLYEMRSDDLIELSIEIDRMNKEREKNQNESTNPEADRNG